MTPPRSRTGPATPLPAPVQTPRGPLRSLARSFGHSLRRLPLLLAGITLAAVVGAAAPGVARGQGEPGGTEAGNGVAKTADVLRQPDIGFEVESVANLIQLEGPSRNSEPPKRPGVVVSKTMPGSQARDAGIERLSIIHSINGHAIKDVADFTNAVASLAVGDSVSIVRSDRQEEASPPKNRKAGAKAKTPYKLMPAVTLSLQSKGQMAVASMDKTQDTFTAKPVVRHQYAKSLKPNHVFLAFQLSDQGRPEHLSWVIQYHGEEWVFMKSVHLRVGGANPMPVNLTGAKRETRIGDDGSVFENAEGPVTPDNAELLYLISQGADEIAIRIEGQNGTKDRLLTASERTALVQTARAYRHMHEPKGGE